MRKWPFRRRNRVMAPRVIDFELPDVWPDDKPTGFVRVGDDRWYFCRPGQAPQPVPKPPSLRTFQ